MVEFLHNANSLGHLHRVVLEGLPDIVPGESYDMVLCQDSGKGNDLFFSSPGTYTAKEIAFMLAHAGEHPAVHAFDKGATGAISISQCSSTREWKSSRLFWEGGCRRLGFHREVAMELPGVASGSLAAISVLRSGKDFSARDRELLTLLQPHLIQAWRQASVRSLGHTPAALRCRYPQLSEREAEILFWIVEGKQNTEIAAILERRLTTVQEHVENIIRKLGAENRHQMTVEVLRACWGIKA